MKKHYELETLLELLDVINQKTVFVHGFFDILHKGHVNLLVEAKKHGDLVIVGLEHDENAKLLKGPDRPFNDYESRLYVLDQIESVDYIFQIPPLHQKESASDFYLKLYKKFQPDVVATNYRAGKHGKYKKEQAEMLGIKFVDIGDLYKNNTTSLLEKLR